MDRISHYDILDEYFQEFAENNGVSCSVAGLISAHGDKFYSHRELFESVGLEFWQGVAIGLLTYINPWTKEVRETKNGFVEFEDWFHKNFKQFVDKFPKRDTKRYHLQWTAPDGFFGDEDHEILAEAQRSKWEYEREACRVTVFKNYENPETQEVVL